MAKLPTQMALYIELIVIESKAASNSYPHRWLLSFVRQTGPQAVRRAADPLSEGGPR